MSRIKSLSSVILDSVDSELTCISVLSFCMLSLLFIYLYTAFGLVLASEAKVASGSGSG